MYFAPRRELAQGTYRLCHTDPRIHHVHSNHITGHATYSDTTLLAYTPNATDSEMLKFS